MAHDAGSNLDAGRFARRREAVLDRMRGEDGRSVLVLGPAPEYVRNGDVHHSYRQDSDLYYLTGFTEPEAVAVLAPGGIGGDGEHADAEFVLFVLPRDPKKEVWTGYRAGPEGACKTFGADAAWTVDELDERMPVILNGADRVHAFLGRYDGWDHRLLGWVEGVRRRVREGFTPPASIVDGAALLHEQRLIKSDDDLAALREACRVSAAGHVAAMAHARPGMNEGEISALLDYEFRRAGSPRLGYPSIVGSGANACILHYVQNDREMRDGDLLLIDAGAEVDFFSADITRTFPVNGTFTEPQRAVYDVVLNAQSAALEACRPGSTWDDVHQVSLRAICEGVIGLGFHDGPVDALIESEDYKRWFMHKTGHWLGMDVHDVGAYRPGGEWRVLEPGMVFTVEPGVYIAPDDDTVDEKWRGIGVRIEDDVLITADGHENLTADVPKDPDEVEAACAAEAAAV